ncbi:MAG: PRC-barrel domain containing protein [Phycisphaerales bacterium]|nr:MAG: PRC-barrel domain containing protein [Phycisphaerales bacterium]
MNPLSNSKTIRRAALPATALTVVLLAGTAAAQQQRQQQDQRQQQQLRERQADERAQRAIAVHTMSDNIIGTDVVDPRGESLGSIDDLVVDLRKGKAPYAVLAFGGTLGFNRDKVAVPMQAFSWDDSEERFVLNTTRDRLEAAPEFDSEDLDKISEESWIDRTLEVFGIDREEGRDARDRRDAGERRNAEQDRRRQDQQRRDQDRDRSAADEEDKHKPFAMGSGIDKIEILGSNGEEVGSINKLVIDRNSGNVAFATLRTGGVRGIGADTHLIPWEAMERTDDKKFRVSISSDRFENAPQLEDEDQLRDAAFIQSVYRYYQVRPDQRRDADQRRDQRRDREERRQQGG